MAVPDMKDGAAATWSACDIVVRDTYFKLHVLAHEMSHGMDFMAAREIGSPVSETGAWQAFFQHDASAVSAYANTHWVENLAEVGIIGKFSSLVLFQRRGNGRRLTTC
jgi:hypothetical protein